jgi:hypothetical protein
LLCNTNSALPSSASPDLWDSRSDRNTRNRMTPACGIGPKPSGVEVGRPPTTCRRLVGGSLGSNEGVTLSHTAGRGLSNVLGRL